MSLRAMLLTAVAMLCFAANSILCRLALLSGLIDAATFTTVRVASAAAMLVLVIWLQGRKLPRATRASLLSALALFAYLVFFSFAYLRLEAGPGALILIGAVQFTMFIVAFYEGERFTPAQWTGVGLALFGLVYLVLPGVSAPDLLGAVLMMLSGVGWGCFSLLARGAQDPVAANAGNFLWCLLPALLVGLFDQHHFAAAAAGLLFAVLAGAIATGFGYVVWYLALRDLSAAQAATVQLSMPALVGIAGTVFLSEPFTVRLLTASVAMLGGIALVFSRRVERSAA
ncbi:MAG: DMT family transporter [Hyphomicrobiales bacterium]|nr:DMT family transporter [Hyphomicrobiales bacterium]